MEDTQKHTIEAHYWDNDYECLVVRHSMGHLCGYVRIPENHPWYKVNYSDPITTHSWITRLKAKIARRHLDDYSLRLDGHVNVHGGLTFSGDMKHLGFEGHWLGFDCMHYMDAIDTHYVPEILKKIKSFQDGHVWTVEEVQREISRMIDDIEKVRIFKS